MFRFLPGILLIQAVTAGLVLFSIRWSQEPQLIIVAVVFGIISAVLTTFWFGSIVHNIQQSALTKMQAKHAQDREKMIRRAEREKAQVTSKSQQQRGKIRPESQCASQFQGGRGLCRCRRRCRFDDFQPTGHSRRYGPYCLRQRAGRLSSAGKTGPCSVEKSTGNHRRYPRCNQTA